MIKNIPEIERVVEATEQLAFDVGSLMPDLSDSLSDIPIELDFLTQIVESPDRDLFVARLNGRIVGSAVMNLIVFTTGKKAWLEDFVVTSDESIRGSGIGFALWKEIINWSREREAPLEFTSSTLRERAHEFYHRQGAKIKPTSVFHFDTKQD